MPMIARVGINLEKIQTNFTKDKNGNRWVNVEVVINDEADKYGNDASVRIAQTKEQREAKDKAIYLGNGKVVWRGKSKQEVSESEPTENSPF